MELTPILQRAATPPDEGKPLPLFGERVAGKRKWEQPWHRAAAYLFAAGRTNKEVAEACEVAQTTVSMLMRERWFQENVVNLMAENGSKDIAELFKGEAFASLAKMIELRDNPKTPSVVVSGICRDILDRYMGKATQRIETVGTPSSSDPVAEAERLERENARLGAS